MTPDLLELYVRMASPTDSSLETEFSEFCAFNFPGVFNCCPLSRSLTLSFLSHQPSSTSSTAVIQAVGPEGWPRLKEAFRQLTTDLQWKVRRTLAFSLHEVAKILGREHTESDLVPVFDSFLKDIEEVEKRRTFPAKGEMPFLKELVVCVVIHYRSKSASSSICVTFWDSLRHQRLKNTCPPCLSC